MRVLAWTHPTWSLPYCPPARVGTGLATEPFCRHENRRTERGFPTTCVSFEVTGLAEHLFFSAAAFPPLQRPSVHTVVMSLGVGGARG